MSTPEIRFISEQDDWELFDLEQNATYSKGRGYSKNDVVKTGTPVVLYGRLYTNFELEIDQVDTFVHPIQDSVISAGNEVVVPASGETPEDIARASAVIRPGLILGSDLNIIRPNAKLNPTFLASSLTYGVASKDLMSKSQGNVIVHLKNDDIRSLTVSVPSPVEQTKINSFFRHVDNQINGLKDTAGQLKSLKQTMLVKMFPQDGASVPEIRFEGFTGNWEQTSIEYLADTLTGFPFPSEKFEASGIRLIRGINVKRGYVDDSDANSEFWESSKGIERYLLEENDILLQMDGALIGKSMAKIQKKHLPALLVQRVTRLRSNKDIDQEFLYQAFRLRFLEYIRESKTETAVPHLSLTDIREYPVSIPSYEEQAAIGSYFRQLDKLIELEEAKLAKLTQLKTAFLAKMFV
ncbi:restriction endonuclease subunit S [Rothia amarae]|uniref:Restriction endonuclease subunit S n=1 Tax=Rothia amarae TaxID=169480 RepID=A0A7H2BJS9_9MICC|nr:restriction endonuclease subunit S [Rothia amarae]QNV39925.1 restriction endonuclease subunit S [Rothia amarae]